MSFADTKYEFTSTQDWFSFNEDSWTGLMPLVTSSSPRVLEIGSWEGRSAVFLLENLVGEEGELVCIDHFDLLATGAGRERLCKVTHNLSLTKRRFRIIDEFSIPALMKLLEEEMKRDEPGFDWIYVDGSHEADDTFLDGELVWRLAKQGAVIIFDDYHWPKEPEDSIHHPRRGVDAFMALHVGEYHKVSMPQQYQMVLQKTIPMRIGFLVKDSYTPRAAGSLTYEANGVNAERGINVALAIDAAFVMSAAVAIRSVLDHTPGRITFYIIVYQLPATEREMLVASVTTTRDVSIVFLDAPDSLAATMGIHWLKLDMLRLLPSPVDRVLYLDADTFTQANITDLWKVDLAEKSLGAVIDVGHPMGHPKTPRRPYFNAGVLLLDLVKVRPTLADLVDVARLMQHSPYRDQDALNEHFASDWLSLPREWNAQGLGTYANTPSPDRDALQRMGPPKVVHFTGPLHPNMANMMDPYNQPCTSKPWGYAGASGHPYAEKWWEVLESTPWKQLRTSRDWKKKCELAEEAVIQRGVQEFKEKVKSGRSASIQVEKEVSSCAS